MVVVEVVGGYVCVHTLVVVEVVGGYVCVHTLVVVEVVGGYDCVHTLRLLVIDCNVAFSSWHPKQRKLMLCNKVLLNQPIFMKAFACLISLQTNCKDCEASKDHLAMYTLTHIHPLLITCPDPMKCAIAAISELEKGYYSVSITYIPTHYNHDQKLGHLRLSNSTKNSVAEKLKEGIDVSHIIDSFRNSEMADGIFCDHLITEKDINNIRKRFNVDGIQKHSNDFVSVANIVGEMQTLDYNSILLYKQQGEEPSEECKLLNTRDFLLVIQTEFQKDMLIKHGSEGVCMDATYNVNNYDFHLITLLVLDDYQEGIPAAYAISNREDKLVIKYILESIKLKCKGFKSCSWFMSDMALQYFNACKEVFDTTNTNYLWCGWHIDRAWRKAIKRYLNSFEEQKEIYHQLRTLMMETSQIGFKQLLTKFLTTHKFTKFMEYFQSYCNHCEQWALCFRPGSPMICRILS